MSAKQSFEGWYYKQQTDDSFLALIPGRSGNGAFIQVLTEHSSYNIEYGLRKYNHDGQRIRVGGSEFSPDGVQLDIRSDELALSGHLRYSHLSPIKGDIMGPFRFFPMECRHGVGSMLHQVDGEITLNGQDIRFTNGKGYMESDSGRSFPSEYMWVQCNDFTETCSIMVSVARIPFAGFHFWGCIAVVWLDGREYRLATYLGAKIERFEPCKLTLRQRTLCLDIEIVRQTGHELYAPRQGAMNRTIRESAVCTAHFCFTESGRKLFEASSSRASYEYDKTEESHAISMERELR